MEPKLFDGFTTELVRAQCSALHEDLEGNTLYTPVVIIHHDISGVLILSLIWLAFREILSISSLQ